MERDLIAIMRVSLGVSHIRADGFGPEGIAAFRDIFEKAKFQEDASLNDVLSQIRKTHFKFVDELTRVRSYFSTDVLR